MSSRFLLANANQQIARQTLKENSNINQKFTLRSWHWALLIGVPSATVLSYFLYKRYCSSNTLANKQIEENNNKQKVETAKKETIAKPKSELEKAVDVKNKGNEFFQMGNFEEAVRCYTEAIELCPKTDLVELPKFYQNRAAALENLKFYDKVIEDCTLALSIEKNYEKALTRRAKAYESVGKLEEAFEDLTSLCILQKFSSSSMAHADRLVKKIGEKMAQEIFSSRKGIPISQHFVDNFFVGLNNDIVYKNNEFYMRCAEAHSATSYMKEAVDAFNAGNYEQCVELCTKEIDEKKEFDFEAHNLRGSLYMLKCQYAESKADFDYLLNEPAASARLKSNSLVKLTALNLQNGQEEEAYRNYDRAIELDPTNEDIYVNRAQVYAMKGMFEQCFQDFEKCLEINAANKIAKIQKAFFEYRQFFASMQMYFQATQQTMDAIKQNAEFKLERAKIEKVLEENADVPEAVNLYAQILSEQEDYEKAEEYYRKGLDADPKNASLMVQRALNLMTWTNDFEDAVKMLDQAIQTDDTCEFAYETLATIEIQRGNLSRAVELFEKAVQLTRSKESMTNLCCMLIGARTQFKVLSHFSQNPEIVNQLSRSNFI